MMEWCQPPGCSIYALSAVIGAAVASLLLILWFIFARSRHEVHVFGDIDQTRYSSLSKDVLSGWKRIDQQHPDAKINTKALVFVHGFGGDPSGTWRSGDAEDSFPELIVRDAQLSEFDVFMFQYSTSPWRKLDIERLAQQLRNMMLQHLAGYRVVLIAHSLGGLICMQYVITLLKESKRPNLIGLILYGTPTSGLEMVHIARHLGGLLFRLPLLRTVVSTLVHNVGDLASTSQIVQRLHGDWIAHVANGGSSDVQSQQKAWFPVRVVTGNDDWVVREDSARGIYGRIDWHPLETDHRGLVKPTCHNDPQYLAARGFILESLQTKPESALLKLKSASDWVWNLLKEPLVSNWDFELCLNDGRQEIDSKLVLGPEFSILEVTKSRFTFVLPKTPIALGLALGRAAHESAWKEHSPVYIHAIRPNTISQSEKERITAAFDVRHGDARAAWDSLFSKTHMRVRKAGTKGWHGLLQETPELGVDYIVSNFKVPPEAESLVGQMVELEFGFRTIHPNALTEFTWHFKWLTEKCCAQVRVNETEFLFANVYTIGVSGFKIEPEDFGNRKAVKVSTDEIVLPETVVRFRWSSSRKGG